MWLKMLCEARMHCQRRLVDGHSGTVGAAKRLLRIEGNWPFGDFDTPLAQIASKVLQAAVHDPQRDEGETEQKYIDGQRRRCQTARADRYTNGLF
jgi:hypothetical protein